MFRRTLSLLLAVLLVLAGCSTELLDSLDDPVDDTELLDTESLDEVAEEPTREPVEPEPAAQAPSEPTPEPTPDYGDEWAGGENDRAGYDPSLTGSGLCLDNAGDPLEGIVYTTAHEVVDGQLGAPCFGDEDDTLISAWFILSDITPPEQLRDLALFAGFEADDSGDEADTLAFVAPVDDDGTQFQMAVNLPSSRNDWDEAALTMAHEFSHVFTAVPTELDRYAPEGSCPTYDNLEGCYQPESIMAGWYAQFWPDLGYEPGDTAADEADGEGRCAINPGFFGAYGASNPEEDFAESFAAYVMGVEPLSDGQQRRLDWIDQFGGLREFRDRAEAAGYGPFANNFGECGLG